MVQSIRSDPYGYCFNIINVDKCSLIIDLLWQLLDHRLFLMREISLIASCGNLASFILTCLTLKLAEICMWNGYALYAAGISSVAVHSHLCDKQTTGCRHAPSRTGDPTHPP